MTEETIIIELKVHGRVGSSGSKTFYKGKLIPASKYQRPWQEAIKYAFLESKWCKMAPLDCAISVEYEFYKIRPQSHFKSNGGLSKEGQKHSCPDKRAEPDFDKAARAVSDALTGLVWKDDKRIVEAYICWCWADWQGAIIRIYNEVTYE